MTHRILTLLAAAALPALIGAAELKLASGGKTDYSIVVRAEAPRLEKAAAADLVNEGMGVQFVLKVAGFAEDPPELPKVQVGEYQYGNVGITLEDAVKAIAGLVGYTFKIRSDGVVTIVKENDH